jgi:hypothetical protein
MSVALLNIVIDFLGPIGPGIVVGEYVTSMHETELLLVSDTIRRILKTKPSKLLRWRVTWREQTVEIVQ